MRPMICIKNSSTAILVDLELLHHLLHQLRFKC
jgi:hypothetical protein